MKSVDLKWWLRGRRNGGAAPREGAAPAAGGAGAAAADNMQKGNPHFTYMRTSRLVVRIRESILPARPAFLHPNSLQRSQSHSSIRRPSAAGDGEETGTVVAAEEEASSSSRSKPAVVSGNGPGFHLAGRHLFSTRPSHDIMVFSRRFGDPSPPPSRHQPVLLPFVRSTRFSFIYISLSLARLLSSSFLSSQILREFLLGSGFALHPQVILFGLQRSRRQCSMMSWGICFSSFPPWDFIHDGVCSKEAEGRNYWFACQQPGFEYES